jgi:hypothetical protein
VELSDVEKRVAKLQAKLISHPDSLSASVRSEAVLQYAAALARHYFPKRADNETYLAPVVHAFACDLVVAPVIHQCHHLWRYNYDDLDILAQFYVFTTPSRKYYHVAQGESARPTPEEMRKGCALLKIDLGEHLEELFNTYYLEGARSRVAARVLESIGGLCRDHELNRYYGFLELPSHRNLRAFQGQGKYRFLRRGCQWMALGTAPSHNTLDLRQEALGNLFGYRIQVGAKNKIQTWVSRRTMEQAKAEIAAMLESESAQVHWLVNRVSRFYKHFHLEHRFANATDWVEMDKWVLRHVRRFLRRLPKMEFSIYQATRNKPWMSNYLPHRSNFFWNVSELKCDYADIWNPYRWPEPKREYLLDPGQSGK